MTTKEIVKRLRMIAAQRRKEGFALLAYETDQEADIIESLEAENKRLRQTVQTAYPFERLHALEEENKRLRDQFRHVDELDWRWIDEFLALSSSGNAPFWRHVLRDARAALKEGEG